MTTNTKSGKYTITYLCGDEVRFNVLGDELKLGMRVEAYRDPIVATGYAHGQGRFFTTTIPIGKIVRARRRYLCEAPACKATIEPDDLCASEPNYGAVHWCVDCVRPLISDAQTTDTRIPDIAYEDTP